MGFLGAALRRHSWGLAEASATTRLMSVVLPVPGGPTRRTALALRTARRTSCQMRSSMASLGAGGGCEADSGCAASALLALDWRTGVTPRIDGQFTADAVAA